MTQPAPSRLLQPAARPLPVAARSRAAVVLASVAQRALPVVAESVAAGVALLAAEQAARSVIVRAAAHVLPAVPAPARPPTRLFASYTETTIVERYRARR